MATARHGALSLVTGTICVLDQDMQHTIDVEFLHRSMLIFINLDDLAFVKVIHYKAAGSLWVCR